METNRYNIRNLIKDEIMTMGYKMEAVSLKDKNQGYVFKKGVNVFHLTFDKENCLIKNKKDNTFVNINIENGKRSINAMDNELTKILTSLTVMLYKRTPLNLTN
jgi:hypothetical protein